MAGTSCSSIFCSFWKSSTAPVSWFLLPNSFTADVNLGSPHSWISIVGATHPSLWCWSNRQSYMPAARKPCARCKIDTDVGPHHKLANDIYPEART